MPKGAGKAHDSLRQPVDAVCSLAPREYQARVGVSAILPGIGLKTRTASSHLTAPTPCGARRVDRPGRQSCSISMRAATRSSSGCSRRRECSGLTALYADEAKFRSRVVMERHGFGRGEYKYFRYPLPPLVAVPAQALYPRLAPIANRWNEAMRVDVRYPDSHAEYLAALSRRRAGRADAASLEIRRRRLQRLASRPLWRARFPAASRGPSLRARPRFYRAASSSSPNNGRGCSRGPKSSRCGRGTPLSLPCINGPCRGRAAPTGSSCAMASAGYARVIA